MFFSRITVAALVALVGLPLIAMANPVELAARETCASGSQLECCNGLDSANSATGKLLLGLLGIVVNDPSTLIGLNCSPINAGDSCGSAGAVCCVNNNVAGLISIGCVPATP